MGTDVLSSIGVIASDGTIVYLSTAGVAAEAVSRAAARRDGSVAVVGHRDHAKRIRPRNRRA